MRELTNEERERLKTVLHTDDAGLDAWIESKKTRIEDDPIALDTYEARVVDHHKRLMAAAWRAADDIVKVPSDHPEMSVATVWTIISNVAIAIHNSAAREIEREQKNPRDV